MRGTLQASWRDAVAALHARATETGRTRWLALRWRSPAADPLAIFNEKDSGDGFFWQAPDASFAIAGLGVAHAIEVSGGGRFSEASVRSRELFTDLEVCELDGGGPTPEVDAGAPVVVRGPLLVGGFAFYEDEPPAESSWHEFGAGRLVLPELLVVANEQGAECTSCHAIPADRKLDSIQREVGLQLERARARALRRLPPEAQWQGDPSHGCSDVLLDALCDDETGPEYRVRSDRPHSRYCGDVEAALADIAAGKLSKVVLGRSLEVIHDGRFDLAHFIGSLRSTYPSCVTLAVRRGDRCFVSATPERLVSLAAGHVATAAVAGSAARGRSPEEEEGLGRFLLESEKERAEHDLVRRAIVSGLKDVCGEIDGPKAPRLLRLEGIQHLETPLRGELLADQRERVGILELVNRLHPTPAVAGTPSPVAVDWLARHEGLDRGWYTGPVGYLDARGDGEFRVALRSGLLRGGEARLYAGAGIVAGSKPDQELAETRLKLRALLAPLTEI